MDFLYKDGAQLKELANFKIQATAPTGYTPPLWIDTSTGTLMVLNSTTSSYTR